MCPGVLLVHTTRQEAHRPFFVFAEPISERRHRGTNMTALARRLILPGTWYMNNTKDHEAGYFQELKTGNCIRAFPLHVTHPRAVKTHCPCLL